MHQPCCCCGSYYIIFCFLDTNKHIYNNKSLLLLLDAFAKQIVKRNTDFLHVRAVRGVEGRTPRGCCFLPVNTSAAAARCLWLAVDDWFPLKWDSLLLGSVLYHQTCEYISGQWGNRAFSNNLRLIINERNRTRLTFSYTDAAVSSSRAVEIEICDSSTHLEFRL